MGVDRKHADRCWLIVATSGEARLGTVAGRVGYMALRLFGWWAYRGNRQKRLGGIIVDTQVGTPCTCQPCGDAGTQRPTRRVDSEDALFAQ